MPLPTAPTKRAALLSEQDYDVPARTLPKVRKTAPPVDNATMSEKPQARGASGQADVTGPAATVLERSLPQNRIKSRRAENTRQEIQREPEAAAVIRPKKTKHAGPSKLFVLDTNVLLHDPMCLFRFEEHDIFLPMIVLEELDAHKKGMTEVARNARQTSRTLDALAGHQDADITTGLPLHTTGHREAGGKLFFQTQLLN